MRVRIECITNAIICFFLRNLLYVKNIKNSYSQLSPRNWRQSQYFNLPDSLHSLYAHKFVEDNRKRHISFFNYFSSSFLICFRQDTEKLCAFPKRILPKEMNEESYSQKRKRIFLKVWHVSLINFFLKIDLKGVSSRFCVAEMLGGSHARNFKINITNFSFRYVVYEFGKEKHRGNLWVCSFKPNITHNASFD